MQCTYAQLIEDPSALYIYICIVLDLAVGVVVCKASLLNWLGVCLPSIYMHCTISSIWCSSMQGFCAQLTGGSRSSSGCSGTQGIYAQLMGGLSAIYIYALYYIRGWSGMQGICSQLAGGLDLAVGGVVCKASLLNWLGVHLPSIYMHCTRSSSRCRDMQGICAQLTGGSIYLLYICIVLI